MILGLKIVSILLRLIFYQMHLFTIYLLVLVFADVIRQRCAVQAETDNIPIVPMDYCTINQNYNKILERDW